MAMESTIAIPRMELLQVVDVNQHTLAMFGAAGKAELLANLDKVFRDEMRKHWERELLDMWQGRLESEYEGINYSLNGDPVEVGALQLHRHRSPAAGDGHP